VARAEGKAVMEDKKNEVVLKGNLIEHRDNEDIALIQIGVRILKENIAARCEFARFLRKSNKVELSGIPVVYKKEDEYRATRIIVDLETEEVILQGNVRGTIKSDEDEPGNGDGETAVNE
jgi:lipopolysaccharide export system protein LptA